MGQGCGRLEYRRRRGQPREHRSVHPVRERATIPASDYAEEEADTTSDETQEPRCIGVRSRRLRLPSDTRAEAVDGAADPLAALFHDPRLRSGGGKEPGGRDRPPTLDYETATPGN